MIPGETSEVLRAIARLAESPHRSSRIALPPQSRLIRLTGCDPTVCPVCGKDHLRLMEELEPSVGPPERSPP
jgi:hypothetical protein